MEAVTRKGTRLLIRVLFVSILGAASVEAAVRVPETALGRKEVAPEAAVEARLLIHPDDQGPSRIRVGVLFDLPAGWHTYWRNPGDTGLPTEVEWQIPAALVEPIAWPAPTRYEESEGRLVTHGYSEQVLLASAISFVEPDSVRGVGPRQIAAEIDLLACESACIPLHFSLQRTIDSSAPPFESELERAQIRALFTRYARRLPREPAAAGVRLRALFSQSAIRPGDSFEAAIAVVPLDSVGAIAKEPPVSAQFFPYDLRTTTLAVSGVYAHPRSEAGRLVVLDGTAAFYGGEPDSQLTGVLVLEAETGELSALQVGLPIPTAAAGAEVTQLDWDAAIGLTQARAISWMEGGGSTGELGLVLALLLAFAGGILLNLMPCVLPVLAIKVCGLAEVAHQKRGTQILHGLAYALGVGCSLAALAVAVIALRAAGTSVGWGFQLQEPLFVALVSAVLVLFAMNLFGLFEISLNTGGLASIGSEATGSRRSFFEGLLVVVLATPCSAPFLGTALGFAFASSGPVVLGVFLAIGAGLAAPFVLVSCIPALSRFIPRSGPWMLKLRAVLGFCLLGSAVWLLWVFGRTAGSDGMAALAALLLATAFAAQGFGWVQRAGRRGYAHALGFASAGLLLVGFNSVSVEPPEPESDANALARTWRPFRADAVAEALAEGRPALVSFTADWCITCKVNERTVLSSERVREAIEHLDVATFEADWTRRDERIRAELARFGRAGVPLVVVYSPADPDSPRQLPDLITTGSLLALLHAAAPSPPTPASALPVDASVPRLAQVTDVTRF